jgi:hypothetical protein
VRRLRALAALSADRWEGVLSPGSEPLGGGDLVSCAPVMAAREDSAEVGPEVEEAVVGLATSEDDGGDGVRVGSVLVLPAATRCGLATTPVAWRRRLWSPLRSNCRLWRPGRAPSCHVRSWGLLPLRAWKSPGRPKGWR